jgi:hypothetical protein
MTAFQTLDACITGRPLPPEDAGRAALQQTHARGVFADIHDMWVVEALLVASWF